MENSIAGRERGFHPLPATQTETLGCRHQLADFCACENKCLILGRCLSDSDSAMGERIFHSKLWMGSSDPCISQGIVSEEMTKGKRQRVLGMPAQRTQNSVYLLIQSQIKAVLKFRILNLSLLFPQTEPCS